MKKTSVIVMLIMFFLFISVANAEVNMSVDIATTGDVNLETNVNTSGNVTVVIDGTNIGEQVGGLEEDVYGQPHSNPKDFILEEEFGGQTEAIPIADLCSDLAQKGYITETATSVMPQGFVDYLKALGYDDESHINYIWNLCQELKFNYQSSYIAEHEPDWTEGDGVGISLDNVVDAIHEAVNYLLGLTGTSDQAKQIAYDLDRYFASDRDVYNLNSRVSNLELEAEAVSRTMQNIAADAYCQAKIDMMMEYNFTSVTCGNTTYFYWQVAHSPVQTKIIGVTPSGYKKATSDSLDIQYEQAPGSLMNYVPGVTKPMIIDYSPKEMIKNTNTFRLYVYTNAPTDCQYNKGFFRFGEGNDFDEGQGSMIHKSVLTELDDGTYEYYIRCADAFGKTAFYPTGQPVKSVVTIDTENPEMVCFVSEDKLSYAAATSTEVSCVVSDMTGAETVEAYGFEGVMELGPCEENGEYCGTLNIEDLAEGTYTLSARVVDKAGNENFDNDFARITVDKTPLPKEETSNGGGLTGLFSVFTSNIFQPITDFFTGG